MANLANLTLAQLRSATKQQIIDAINVRLNAATKRQIIEALLDIIELSDEPIRTYRPDGQIESDTTVIRSVIGGRIGSQVATWTYYDTGEVDTITIRALDAADQETKRRTIKHFTDGRQPEVS